MALYLPQMYKVLLHEPVTSSSIFLGTVCKMIELHFAADFIADSHVCKHHPPKRKLMIINVDSTSLSFTQIFSVCHGACIQKHFPQNRVKPGVELGFQIQCS